MSYLAEVKKQLQSGSKIATSRNVCRQEDQSQNSTTSFELKPAQQAELKAVRLMTDTLNYFPWKLLSDIV